MAATQLEIDTLTQKDRILEDICGIIYRNDKSRRLKRLRPFLTDPFFLPPERNRGSSRPGSPNMFYLTRDDGETYIGLEAFLRQKPAPALLRKIASQAVRLITLLDTHECGSGWLSIQHMCVRPKDHALRFLYREPFFRRVCEEDDDILFDEQLMWDVRLSKGKHYSQHRLLCRILTSQADGDNADLFETADEQYQKSISGQLTQFLCDFGAPIDRGMLELLSAAENAPPDGNQDTTAPNIDHAQPGGAAAAVRNDILHPDHIIFLLLPKVGDLGLSELRPLASAVAKTQDALRLENTGRQNALALLYCIPLPVTPDAKHDECIMVQRSSFSQHFRAALEPGCYKGKFSARIKSLAAAEDALQQGRSVCLYIFEQEPVNDAAIDRTYNQLAWRQEDLETAYPGKLKIKTIPV